MGLNQDVLVSPFVGERYAAGIPLSDVVAPPYDVIDGGARDTLAQRHAANVVHVILPQGQGDRYASAARRLADWRSQGLLAPDPEPGLYVVRQRFTTPDGASHTRTGVIAGVVAEPFAGERVKPHERTHAGPKQDRLALLRATQTMCEALLMLSRDPAGQLRRGLDEVTALPPLARAALDGVDISLWRVAGKRATALAEAASREPLYLADGHHRYETAVAYGNENPRAARTLALIVPIGDPGLVILPTHRLVPGTPGDDLLDRLRGSAQVEVLSRGGDARQALASVGVAGGGCVVSVRGALYRVVRDAKREPHALQEMAPVVRSLDVAWADTVVIPHLIPSRGTDGLRYTPDWDAALRAVEAGDAGAAVLLNPPAMEQVLAVADAGAFMPPKATFFTPKVPSGLVFLRYSTPSP